jgi:hypothetical protein
MQGRAGGTGGEFGPKDLGTTGPNDTLCLIVFSACVFVLFLSFVRVFFITVLRADEYTRKKQTKKIVLK